MEITKYIQSIVDTLVANEAKLNDLDAEIGDGDHGSNIVRGFKAVLSQASSFTKESPIEKDLMTCAQQLMSKIGGSSGPLLGSAFMALATAFKGKITINNQDVANGLEMAFNRISQLGKSKVGEKTMLDALFPTISAMKNTNGQLDFSQAALVAQQAAEATIPMLATKGRASYLGERSIGHMDPGACSISLIFLALTKVNEINVDKQAANSNKEAQVSETTNNNKLLPITKNVSILLISHSEQLAKATIQFANEMKSGDFAFEYIAGIENGKLFGTDPQEIKRRIEKLVINSEVLIIYDLGSSKMNSEMAISLLPPDYAKRVKIASCAFVEGAIIAVSSNNTTSAEELCQITESQMHVDK
jgi:dihydroxyacetone kinase-like protein